jgi:hypothetical protein
VIFVIPITPLTAMMKRSRSATAVRASAAISVAACQATESASANISIFMKTSPMRISRLRRDSARCARLFDRLRSFPTCSAHIHRLGVRPQNRIDDWPRLFDIFFAGKKRKDAPASESKVISLEERAKVTEALEAILDEGGSRLSATDIVRLKAGWETQSCEVGLTPALLVICPKHTIFYKPRTDPYRT